jgi:hypothetical protein
MKLSKWAKEQGISYQTALRWFKKGTLPVPAIKTKSGTILVNGFLLPIRENTNIDIGDLVGIDENGYAVSMNPKLNHKFVGLKK